MSTYYAIVRKGSIVNVIKNHERKPLISRSQEKITSDAVNMTREYKKPYMVAKVKISIVR